MTGPPRAGSEPAPAKVNLYLHVLGRRPDAYHLLDSLAVFAEVGDVVHAHRADAFELDVIGPYASALGEPADNLVLRAARALQSAAGAGWPARLVLEKRLPVAAGLGGGSSDAAATLRLLARLWEIHVPLTPIAAALGADVPVCLAGRPTRMTGIGDLLSPAPRLPEFGLALVNPGVEVPTRSVFALHDGAYSQTAALPQSWTHVMAMATGLSALRNDLEPPASMLAPVIATVMEALALQPECRLVRMSGSGATCFGLFDTPDAARHAARNLERAGWWCWGGAGATIAGAPNAGY